MLGLVEGPVRPGRLLDGRLSRLRALAAGARADRGAGAGRDAGDADSPEQRLARDDSIRLLGEAGAHLLDDLAPKVFAEGVDPAVVARAREIAFEQPLTGLVAAQETIRDRVDSRPTLARSTCPSSSSSARRTG